ncbi:hypothetical protein V6N13_130932 [Hibiscus sabdariffa]
MHEARSLPTHTTISPLTCPLRTSSSIHTHQSTTHTTERFGRGAEETMSEGTPQPLGTIKSEKRVNPQISCREGNRVGWVTQQQYPLRLDQASSTEPTRSCINMTKASSGWPSRGHELPPPTGHGQGSDLPSDGISHSKGTLPDIGNLVMESLAAPPSVSSPFGRPCPGNSISFVTRSPTDSINPKFSDRPPLGTGGAYPLAPRRPPRPPRGARARTPGKATLPLTIPRRVFKSSAKDSTAARWKLRFRAARTDLSDARATPTTRALGGQRPLLRVGNRATGACVASSPDSDLEAFSHNPAHGSFAPLAFQPSAMTNCANQRFLSY